MHVLKAALYFRRDPRRERTKRLLSNKPRWHDHPLKLGIVQPCILNKWRSFKISFVKSFRRTGFGFPQSPGSLRAARCEKLLKQAHQAHLDHQNLHMFLRTVSFEKAPHTPALEDDLLAVIVEERQMLLSLAEVLCREKHGRAHL